MARRFRFSIRTLAILVVLIGVYLGCWTPTRNAAQADRPTKVARFGSVSVYRDQTRPLIPLFLTQYESVIDHNKRTLVYQRSFYFWLFGLRIKLPVELEWKDDDVRAFYDQKRADERADLGLD